MLVLLLASLSLASSKGQSFQLQFGEQKQGVSVINKVTGNAEDFSKKASLLEKAFAEAIIAYTKALEDPDHPLNKTIGPLRRPIALQTIKNINITVMMLDKDDPQDHPMTWKIPSVLGSGESFVTKVN